MFNFESIKQGVLIYGTAAGGEALLQMCQEKNINVLGFCDDKSVQIGLDFNGVEIVRFLDYVSKYPETPILVGIRGIDAIAYKLKKLNVKQWYLCDELLRDVDYTKYEYGSGKAYGIMEVENTIDCHRKYHQKNYFFINNLDLVITTKCSLKCRYCCNLMQYFEHPWNFTLAELTHNVRKLLTYVSELNEMRVIGGEPFVHPELAQIIEMLIGENKIKKISILSNGSIMPNEQQWKIFENDKVILTYSDYGPAKSRNLNAIKEIALKRGVNCYFKEKEDWADCSRIDDYHRDKDNLIRTLEECCAKHLYSMVGDTIYRCPFMGNAEALGAISVPHEEKFNVNDYLRDIISGQEMIKHLFYEKDCFTGCNYCPGRPYETSLIPPAEQTKEVLSFNIFKA